MARQTKRNVKRQSYSGRQGLVGQYYHRKWYELEDWAKEWVIDYLPWAVLIMVGLLAPSAILALVLGFHALPLEFIGIPANANSIGLAAVFLVVEFFLLALAVRPLFRRRKRGLNLLTAATLVHLVQSVILQHAITGAFELALVLYLYIQVRRRYTTE